MLDRSPSDRLESIYKRQTQRRTQKIDSMSCSTVWGIPGSRTRSPAMNCHVPWWQDTLGTQETYCVRHCTHSACSLTLRIGFVLWIDKFAEIPVNQRAVVDIVFRAHEHDIARAQIAMQNTSLVSSLVSCDTSQHTLHDYQRLTNLPSKEE